MCFLKPSYDQIHRACEDFAKQIQKDAKDIKCVAGIARGGLFPALILSHLLELPMISIDYSSMSGMGDDKNHTNKLPALTADDGPILLADDISDSGKILQEILYYYSRSNVSIQTAVLYYKTHDSPLIVPDYIWRTIPHDSDWVIFPYDSKSPA